MCACIQNTPEITTLLLVFHKHPGWLCVPLAHQAAVPFLRALSRDMGRSRSKGRGWPEPPAPAPFPPAFLPHMA